MRFIEIYGMKYPLKKDQGVALVNFLKSKGINVSDLITDSEKIELSLELFEEYEKEIIEIVHNSKISGRLNRTYNNLADRHYINNHIY